MSDYRYEHALNLMEAAEEEIVGPVDYRHSFVHMTGLEVFLSEGHTETLCSPAMGYAFAAGTTDGPGMFGFTQGETSGNPFWDKVRDFLSEPTQEEIKCQAPKPILLNTADIDKPYEWDPETVAVQIFRIGNLFILSVPSEFTTMAGRRLRKEIESIIRDSGIIPKDQKIYVTIAGLSNGYSSYVTTFEEYQAQRYEAASTIYGPYTLDAYIQEFSRLARDLVSGNPSDSDPPPADLSDVMIELMPPNRFDRTPVGTSYGDVLTDAQDEVHTIHFSSTRFLPFPHDISECFPFNTYDYISKLQHPFIFCSNLQYFIGDTVVVEFRSANPRNNQRLDGTFLSVQLGVDKVRGLFGGLQMFKTDWQSVAVDGDWETKFHWRNVVDDPLAFGVSGVR